MVYRKHNWEDYDIIFSRHSYYILISYYMNVLYYVSNFQCHFCQKKELQLEEER